MRGKKPYNIRNVEAHLNSYQSQTVAPNQRPFVFVPLQQQQNEFINAKFGVSKYASNLVSGKMFKKI